MKIPRLLLAALLSAAFLPAMSAAEPPAAPAPGTRFAYLGGGCFWCVEAVFESEPGVKSVVSGYAGGTTENPTYEEVCSGRTGHAEVARIEYDPAQTSYERLLALFWESHDPTTLNRQGADRGTQYRSIILFTTDEERAAAAKSKAGAASGFSDPIVTEIVPLTRFYAAESYHQDYYRRNRSAPYCQFVIRPKLKKLGKE